MPTFTNLKVDVPADEPVIHFERFLHAPPEVVCRMFTEPEHLRRWWGPHVMVIEICEVDLRVGGAWRCTQRDPDGEEHGFHGHFRELEPARRLVRTFVYEGVPEHEAVETQLFEAAEGGTIVRTSLLCDSFEARRFHLQAGMEAGSAETYLQLDELLESLK
jgi:uncharacterized protein YndB with AHSA1/START domain